ncbi:Ubiquitin carboxyl-terminal hydrolase 13 [Morus notabilis]|uniref:Ubiquitin carboxyl-terminal hydrolase 13 n=1 Tax=Morus notabilis TaxID=981085 RepID=W9QKA5_9ROSA|nr:Ubiquitin carboxyl-terminal hydrolase 13 [Morus notabilis]
MGFFSWSLQVPLGTFKDPSNGYLVDDTCVFGAEVFVIKNTAKWEFLTLISSLDIADATFNWKIEKFFLLDKETFSESEKFIVGGKKWNLMIYPNGENGFKGKAVSLYLMPSDWEDIETKAAVYAEYKLRLLDQLNGKHHERSASTWFGASNGYGCPKFISLEDLLKPSNGFIVNDSLIVEVEFIVVSETKCFPEISKSL